MANEIVLIDNSWAVLQELEKNVATALEEIGLRAEGYAKSLTPVGTPESTGIEGYSTNGLRQSITHKVIGNEVYIGTNKTTRNANGQEVPYPVYVEFGTGIYASDGTGRQSPWTWYDKNGKRHWTRGMKPNHMLKKSVEDHIDEYKRVLERYLRNG